MKITMRNGAITEVPFHTGTCSGYIAKSIEIEPRDLKTMARLLVNRPEDLHTALLQLTARFESERGLAAADVTDPLLKDILVLGYVLLRVAVMYYRNAVFGDLVMRNVSYGSRGQPMWVPVAWEWDAKWWKPKDATRDLERAGALCLAERDRLGPKPHLHVLHKLGLICEALINIETPRQRSAQLLRSIAGLPL